MIRIAFELIPDGIDEFKVEAKNQIIIGCKFPLRSKHQDLIVMTNTRRAYIRDFDLDSTLYHPKDGHQSIEEIVYAAIEALRTESIPIQPGEIYPGMQAISLEDFEEKIKTLEKNYGDDIKSIKLIGSRVVNNPTRKGFVDSYKDFLSTQPLESAEGAVLLNSFPDYIPYIIVIELCPDLYGLKNGKNNEGEAMESIITYQYSLRPFERISMMRCWNGLNFNFLRPHGGIAFHKLHHDIMAILPDPLMELVSNTKAGKIKRMLKNGPVLTIGRSIT